MTRTKSSRALVSVVLAVLMAVAFMPAISFSSFAATAKKATKVTKVYHKANTTFTRTAGTAWTLKYKLSPSKLTAAAKKVVWKSSNKSVVSVSAKSGNRAAVSFKKAGTATVTVYTKANKKAKATWKFKVVNAPAKVAATGVTVKANNSTDYTQTLSVGTELTATVAPADATGVTYQWYADGTAIDGATSANFTVTADQIGKTITVKATDDSKNTVESAKSAAVAQPTLNGIQAIDGTPAVGNKLTVKAAESSVGVKNLEDVATIQWYRVTKDVNGKEVETAISGATSASYTVTAADYTGDNYNTGATKLRVKVTPKSGVKALQTSAANWDTTAKAYVSTTGVTAKASTTLSGVEIQVNGTAVKNTDDIKAGTTLTAVVTPAAASNDVDYQWYKNGYKIDGATSATYTPSESGAYTVKATVKATSTAYAANTVDTAAANVANVKASKTFTGVTVTNVDAKNANRTTTLAGDKIAVSVSGIKADAANYTAVLKEVTPGEYGETKYSDPVATGAVAGDAYTMTIPENAAAGHKYVVVLTGQGTNADYGYTSDVLTVSASGTLTGYSTEPVNNGKSYKLNAPSDKTINKDYTVQWYKITTDATGLVSRTEISGATGDTYELTTADQTADAKAKSVQYVAKVTLTDGTVGFVNGSTIAPKIDDAALI